MRILSDKEKSVKYRYLLPAFIASARELPSTAVAVAFSSLRRPNFPGKESKKKQKIK